MIVGVDIGAGGVYGAALYKDTVFPLNPFCETGIRVDENAPCGKSAAAMLEQLCAAAQVCFSEEVTQVRLVCPAHASTQEREALASAAVGVGCSAVLVEQPLAVAGCFAKLCEMQAGQQCIVCDFGATSFDVSLLEKTAEGFTLLSAISSTELTGEDLCKSLRDEVLRRIGAKRDLGGVPEDPAFIALLTRECREAMHRLSLDTSTQITIPFGTQAPLEAVMSRTDFNMMIGGRIWKMVRVVEGLAKEHGRSLKQMDYVIGTGGCLQIPYVIEIFERATGQHVLRLPQAKLAAAWGAVLTASQPSVV